MGAKMVPDNIPQLGVEIPELSQVAFVVEDIEDGMDRFGSILGVGPWDIYRFEPPTLTDRTYLGESHDYSMVLALTHPRCDGYPSHPTLGNDDRERVELPSPLLGVERENTGN